MTLLTTDRKLKRETASRDRARAITVTLQPRLLIIARKGTREQYAIDYETILAVARKIDAREKLRLKGKHI